MQDRKIGSFVIVKKQEDSISLAAVFAMLVIACLPFHTLQIAGIGILMLLGIPLLIFCSPILFRNINKKMWDKADVFLMLFFIDGILAYIWSPGFSFESLYNYIKKIMIVVCIYSLPLNEREKRLLMRGIVFASICVGVFILTKTNVYNYEGRFFLSVFGVVQDPNYIGYIFLVPMATSVSLCLNDKKTIKKIIGFIAVILIVYCILLTGSRGALLGIGTIAAVEIVSKFKTLTGKIVFCLSIALIVLALFNFLLTFLPGELALRFTLQDVIESRGTKRLDIWLKTFHAIMDKPYKILFGFGSGSSINVIGSATHNLFLQLLLETGILGTSLFVGFTYKWFKRLLKWDLLCLSVMCGCMAMAMTLSVNTNYYFWIVFILCIVCSKAKTPDDGELKI